MISRKDNLLTSITNSNIKLITQYLAELDLSVIAYIPRMVYLNQLLQAAKPNDPDFEILGLIVEKWLGPLESGDFDGFIGDLCGVISISIDSILYVMLGCEDICPEEILTIHLETSNQNFIFALTVQSL